MTVIPHLRTEGIVTFVEPCAASAIWLPQSMPLRLPLRPCTIPSERNSISKAHMSFAMMNAAGRTAKAGVFSVNSTGTIYPRWPLGGRKVLKVKGNSAQAMHGA
ncbi:hypothetical protein [Sinorhizobium medicae]